MDRDREREKEMSGGWEEMPVALTAPFRKTLHICFHFLLFHVTPWWRLPSTAHLSDQPEVFRGSQLRLSWFQRCCGIFLLFLSQISFSLSVLFRFSSLSRILRLRSVSHCIAPGTTCST